MQPTFFTANRDRLMSVIQGGLVVMAGYTSMQAANDTPATFEQESNFWWLTGVEFPDWWMIIDGSRHKSWLVAPKVSENHQIFDGSLTPRGAMEVSGIETVLDSDEAMIMLRGLARQHSMVYTLGEHPYAEYLDFTFNPGPKKNYELLSRIFKSVQDCRLDLTALRAVKQPEEITAIKKAISLTTEAFRQVKEKLPQLSYEYEVEAEFTYHFRRHGARGHAYDPIVASGKNACTLHYAQNNTRLKKRQLLLLDIGARYHGYAADISRTYAIGELTKRQIAVHRAVQDAHYKIIDLIKPGKLVSEYYQAADIIMGEALRKLGLLNDSSDVSIYRQYFPHAISHGLGVDVHDNMGAPKFFQPGMVLTVEPGIYIPAEAIGVRIEDNILVTKTGHSNLSGELSTDW
jgi:Xaa-Pro aminopeptidase